jgi:hypothetical protein
VDFIIFFFFFFFFFFFGFLSLPSLFLFCRPMISRVAYDWQGFKEELHRSAGESINYPTTSFPNNGLPKFPLPPHFQESLALYS